MLQADADIIVNSQWGLDFVSFVRQAKQFGLFDEAVFMNFDTAGDYEVLASLGPDLPDGLVLSGRSHVNWPPSRLNREFTNEFFNRAGRYPSSAANSAYAAILAIADAISASDGVTHKDHIRAELRNLKLKLPEDPEGFMSFMDPQTHQLMQVQAIGVIGPDNSYPPSAKLLSDWTLFYPKGFKQSDRGSASFD